MNLEYLSPNSEFCLVFQPVTQGKWSLIVSCNLFIIKPMITLVSHPINPSPQHFLTFPLCSPLSSFHLLFTCPSFAHSSLTVLVPSTSPLSLPPSQAQHRSSCQKKKKPKFLLTNPDSAQPSPGGYLAASANKGCNPLGEEKSTWQGKGLHGEVTSGLRRPERMRSRMKI